MHTNHCLCPLPYQKLHAVNKNKESIIYKKKKKPKVALFVPFYFNSYIHGKGGNFLVKSSLAQLKKKKEVKREINQ